MSERSKQPCRFANDPNYPCDVDLNKVDVGYHYGKNHLTEPTYEEYRHEVDVLKDMVAHNKEGLKEAAQLLLEADGIMQAQQERIKVLEAAIVDDKLVLLQAKEALEAK